MKIPNETKIKMEEGKEKKKGKGGETERQTYRQTDRGRQAEDGQTDRKRLITIISMEKILAQRLIEMSAVVACDY